MGSRNIDRIPTSMWRERAETVGRMIEQGWAVETRCPRCGLTMTADLVAICRLSPAGPLTSLWNKTPPCRRKGCPGRVTVFARPGGLDVTFDLTAPEPRPEHSRPSGPSKSRSSA